MSTPLPPPPPKGQAPQAADIIVGKTRIRDAAGYRGTVVYVGPVASDKSSRSSVKNKEDDNVVANNKIHATAVAMPQQLYAGVVWDDPSRGKHNGTVLCATTGALVRHFSTTHPTAGSFVKLRKLDTGVALSLHELLRQRYVELGSNECVAPDTFLPHRAQTASGRNDKAIHLLGEMAIRQRQQLPDLSAVSLRLQGISSILIPTTPNILTTTTTTSAAKASANEWTCLQQRLTDIDLAGNLLSDWSTVWQLLDTFPTLQKLSVASNHIGDWTATTNTTTTAASTTTTTTYNNTTHQQQQLQHAHAHLKHLNLNETRIQTVDTILRVGRALPALQELVLANNNNNSNTNSVTMCHSMNESSYCSVTDNKEGGTTTTKTTRSITELANELAEAFPNLVFLDCSNCTALLLRTMLQDDEEVLENNALVTAWSKLPKLQSLSLDDNPDLTGFGKRSDESETAIFYPALQHLQFAGTGVADWKHVAAWNNNFNSDDLSQTTHLTSLRLRNCPITSKLSPAVCRSQIIYSFPGIQVLNASAVTAQERREAARQCIRLQTTSTTKHSQHDYWISQYPELAAAAAAAASRGSPTSAAIANGGDAGLLAVFADFCVVNVTIRSMAAASCTKEPLIRRLPTQLTVGKLKALCARQFRLDIDLQALSFRRSTADAFPEAMDCDDHTLHYYGVPDGAEILMNEIDLEAVAREQEHSTQLLTQRVDQQERELHEFQERQKRANK